MTAQEHRSRGFIIALIATITWSTTGPLISYLVKTYSLPPLVLAFWRDLFVAFGMLAGLSVLSHVLLPLERSHWGFMILYGLTLAVFNSTWTFSVQYNGAAVATILSYFFLSEMLSGVQLGGSLLLLFGVILLRIADRS